jgi:hypothetical protein
MVAYQVIQLNYKTELKKDKKCVAYISFQTVIINQANLLKIAGINGVYRSLFHDYYTHSKVFIHKPHLTAKPSCNNPLQRVTAHEKTASILIQEV